MPEQGRHNANLIDCLCPTDGSGCGPAHFGILWILSNLPFFINLKCNHNAKFGTLFGG
jgi:hypothetical protein